MRILVVDNFDSFVYNLVQYVGQLGYYGDSEDHGCVVWRNNAEELGDQQGFSDSQLRDVLSSFDAILLSPGPGEPSTAGHLMQVIKVAIDAEIPLFGVCLGHQGIGQHFGVPVVRASELCHGKTSPVHHDGSGVLAGVPNPFTVTRYHSLTVDPAAVPDELVVTGTVDSGMIMSMRHRSLPVHSVQFHPESVMTEYGHRMIANWLTEAGFPIDLEVVDRLEREHLAVTGKLTGAS